jgi:hypothetical protein
MFEDDSLPLPDRATLQELIRKCRAVQPFTGTDYNWLVNILVTLEHDAMYALRERMRKYEQEGR